MCVRPGLSVCRPHHASASHFSLREPRLTIIRTLSVTLRNGAIHILDRRLQNLSSQTLHALREAFGLARGRCNRAVFDVAARLSGLNSSTVLRMFRRLSANNGQPTKPVKFSRFVAKAEDTLPAADPNPNSVEVLVMMGVCVPISEIPTLILFVG